MSTSRAVALATIALLATACKVEGGDDSNDTLIQAGSGGMSGGAGTTSAGSTAGPIAGNGTVTQDGVGGAAMPQGGSGTPPTGAGSGAAGTDMTAAGMGGEGTAGSEPMAGGGGPPPVVEDS